MSRRTAVFQTAAYASSATSPRRLSKESENSNLTLFAHDLSQDRPRTERCFKFLHRLDRRWLTPFSPLADQLIGAEVMQQRPGDRPSREATVNKQARPVSVQHSTSESRIAPAKPHPDRRPGREAPARFRRVAPPATWRPRRRVRRESLRTAAPRSSESSGKASSLRHRPRCVRSPRHRGRGSPHDP